MGGSPPNKFRIHNSVEKTRDRVHNSVESKTIDRFQLISIYFQLISIYFELISIYFQLISSYFQLISIYFQLTHQHELQLPETLLRLSDDGKRWKRWDVFSAVAMGGVGGVGGAWWFADSWGSKSVGNVQKNTVNYRKNCFLRMFAGMRSRKKNAVFLHGSSIFEFLVLCCMQPLGCVMCKKHCKYREKNCLRSNVEASFQPQRKNDVIKIHLECILGLTCVMSGQVGGFVWQFTILLGLYWATSGLCSALQHKLEGYMLGLSWPKYGSFQGYVGGLCSALQTYGGSSHGGGGGRHGDLQTFGGQNRGWKRAKKHCKLQEKLLLAHVCGDAFA